MADELGVRRVIAPPAAGVLAALGLVMAGERRDYVQTVLAAGGRRAAAWPRPLAPLVARAERRAARAPAHSAAADCRYAGQSHSLTVPWDPAAPEAALAATFHAAHRERYGDADPGRAVEAVSLRLAAERPGVDPGIARVGARPGDRGPGGDPDGRRHLLGRRGLDGPRRRHRRDRDGAVA